MVVCYVKGGLVPTYVHPPYDITNFDSMSKLSLSMVAQVVGLDIDVYITQIIIGLLVSLCQPATKACTKFDCPQFM